MIMVLLQNMTIKQKLTSIIMFTSIVALLMAGVLFIVWGHVSFRRTMAMNLSIKAEMIADNCQAAMAFEDSEDAEETLKALKADPAIVLGAVYTTTGDVFATYYRDTAHGNLHPKDLITDSYVFADGYLTVCKNIVLDKETVGVVCLRSDLTPVYAMLKRNIGIIVAVILFASLGAYVISSAVQRVISKPVLDLASVAKGVSEEKDYSIRAVKQSNDEIGTLIDAFNNMLENIQYRDSILVESKQDLEKRVSERTAELTVANEQLNRDIIKRERAEENLKKEKIFSESLINSLPGIFYLVDEEGHMLRWNKNMEKVTGRSQEDLTGIKKITDLFVQTDRHAVAKKIANVFNRGEASVEASLATGQGQDQPYLCLGVRIEIDDRPYLVGTGIDITERKNAEKALEDTHKKLVEASRHAGMAEVATDVLHNVGNVLNSINVSTTLISEKVANSEVANLKKVTDLIDEHTEDLAEFFTQDPQGKHIPTYLTEVGNVLTQEQEAIADKLRSLVKNVEHIKEIVNMQQSYSKAAGVEVRTTVSELVENAIQINSAGLERHGVQLVREFTEIGTIEIDKHKVLQILVNLIGNAKYALDNSGKDEKILRVMFDKNTGDKFRIEIADNGVGIEPENITKIFRHGFTTKKHGHGFGLHSGVLAAKEMGGELTVASDGLGCGAKFTLELPYKTVQEPGVV